ATAHAIEENDQTAIKIILGAIVPAIEVGRFLNDIAVLTIEGRSEFRPIGIAHDGSANRGSSSPLRSRARNSSKPPMMRPLTKISGTVRRPPARLTICSRRSSSSETSISSKATFLPLSRALARTQKGQYGVV